MIDSANLAWDTCVFSRYIIANPNDLVSDIESYITDAKRDRRNIYFSAIVLAEIRQSAAKQGKEDELDAFLKDMNSAFIPIDVNPNIAMIAGRLRAVTAHNPPPKKNENPRVLGTGDSIHLATAIYLQTAMGVSDIVFHTLDEGKGKTWEGKCVPLLGFASYYPQATRTRAIQAACNLLISKPLYPQTSLDLGLSDGTTVIPSRSH